MTTHQRLQHNMRNPARQARHNTKHKLARRAAFAEGTRQPRQLTTGIAGLMELFVKTVKVKWTPEPPPEKRDTRS